jgi:UDP-N-acetylbacillosamine N-acetyltransferase
MNAAKVAIVGFGVLGRQLLQQLRERGQCEAVLFDDALAASGEPGAARFAELEHPRYAEHAFYVALGYKHLPRKQQLIERLLLLGRAVPALVHDSAFVDAGARIGPGCVVFPRCTLGPGVVLEPGVLLHAGVILAHDDTVGAASYLAPGVVVSGFVAIGARSFLGSATAVADGVKIGDDAIIGVGSCVTNDVPAGRSAIGNPLRFLAGPLRLR